MVELAMWTNHFPWTRELDAKLLALHRQKLSRRKIGAELGLSLWIVQRRLTKLGIIAGSASGGRPKTKAVGHGLSTTEQRLEFKRTDARFQRAMQRAIACGQEHPR
jgi:hypothetical protein